MGVSVNAWCPMQDHSRRYIVQHKASMQVLRFGPMHSCLLAHGRTLS